MWFAAARMSIATKTGDDGTTGLMYNRRVAKTHPRVEACGAVDELNAAIGLARASGQDPDLGSSLVAIQKDLITIMGELATLPEDLERYEGDKFVIVTPALYMKLDLLVKEIEAQNVSFKGWATPGANLSAATLDMARVACRRAERNILRIYEPPFKPNPAIVTYMNRLSDVLWLMARRAEGHS